MQVVTDPQNYQTSQLVIKGSKSGLSSNKRLLAIKNGFLYYFSQVPKNYKQHSPNVLATIKQLPKNSIQIKAIQQIKMQSSNSTNLIISFYGKDMIQRQDIRKSISAANYVHKKKQINELQEWKFTFDKVLNCRLWYTALLKLKAYFSKQEDKISEFFKNFDPVRRNSHMPTQNNQTGNNNQGYRASQINIVNKFKQQDKYKQSNLPVTLQPSVSPPPSKKQQQPQISSPSFLAVTDKKLQIIDQDEQIKNKKIQDDYRQQIQQQIRQQQKKKNEKYIQQIRSQLQAKNQKIKMLEDAIKATDRLRVIQQQSRQKQRRIQKQKQLQMQKQIQIQKNKQIQLQKNKQKQRQRQRQMIMLQQKNQKKQTKSQQNLTPLPINYSNSNIYLQNNRKAVQLHQFSVQTDQQQQQQQKYNNNKVKRSSQLYLSGLASTQRDTYNIFRNAGSLSFQLQQKDYSYENYDYYTEVQAMQSSQINFQQKIKRQIRLINYTNKMKNIALDIFKQYIDTNHPKKSIQFTGTLFQTKIACQSGKIVNINGYQKLVYSNTQHQNLKRQFKLYCYLQDCFIQMTQKRKRYPLRVPLCFYFEYRGYSGLLKYMPYVKQIQNQNQMERVKKLLGRIVEDDNICNYQIQAIANRINSIYMITVKISYKITKQTQNIQQNPNHLYGPLIFSQMRNKFISTNSLKLQKQMLKLEKNKDLESDKKIMVFNQILTCRNLKKLYRSTQPFSYSSQTQVKTSDFFCQFLTVPENVLSLVTQQTKVNINGLLVSYFQHFFGLQIPIDFNIYTTNLQLTQFTYQPLTRSFPFSSLYPYKLLRNLQSYIISQKYDLVQTAFSILSQLDNIPNNYLLETYKIKYQLKRYSNIQVNALQDMVKVLNQIRSSTGKHNTIWLECFMLTIQCQTLMKQYQECLKTINQTLEYLTYMYGEGCTAGATQDYLYLIVAETLAKMNNHESSMAVYRKLLANKSCTLTKQQISLSIAEVYNNFGQVDTFTLIEFLLTLITKQNMSASQVKKLQQTYIQSKIKKFIGLLYQKINNIDLSIKYLEQSLTYFEQNFVKNQQQVNNVIQICLNLFNSYQRRTDKSIVFAKLILIIQVNTQNQKFSIHIVRLAKAFVTSCFCSLVNQLKEEARNNLRHVLEQLRDQNQYLPQLVHPVSFEDLEKTVQKLSQRAQLGPKQAKVMELLDLSQIQTFIISLA